MEKDVTSNSYRWFALGAVVMGTFMAILDTSIVNIGIPKMMAVFNVSLDDIQWVLTAYTLTLGAIVPLTGFLGEKFGNKKLYIFALISFTLGSLLCGLAWSNSAMIAFRILQALGGGMIMPVSMTIIFQMFGPKERGLALGFWGIATMAAPSIGPTLGGFIIEKLDWRLIFYVNIPIGVMAVILSTILLEEFPHKATQKLDFMGFIFSTVGIVSVLYVLSQNPIDWGDIKNPLLVTIGIFNLILFVINELTVSEPLLDLKVLKKLNFSFSLIALTLINMALMGTVYAIPLFLQRLKGFTAMETGILMFPSAIVTGLMMPISGKIADKINPKVIIIPGLILLGLSSYKLGEIDLNTSWNMTNLLLILRGAGLGLTMMPLTTLGMNVLPQSLITQGSTLQNTFKQIAGSIAITMMTLSLTSKMDINYYRLSEQVTPFNIPAVGLLNQLQGKLTQSGMSSVQAQNQSNNILIGLLKQKASVDAFDYILMLCALFVLAALIAALLIRIKPDQN
jgi:drug resistance transporter, EmrB/QacA subfamily